MDTISREEEYRLKCEKLMNDAYKNIDIFGEELASILEKGGPENDREISILKIASEVISMQLSLSHVQDQAIINADIYIPCGKQLASCEECEFYETCDKAI